MVPFPRMSARTEAVAVLAAAALVLSIASARLAFGQAGAAAIQSFSLSPPGPSTGDPLTLFATVSLDEDCGWVASAKVGFGPQDELGGVPGWGIDLALDPSAPVCVPVLLSLPVQVDLGTLPVAEGQGVLRLRVRGAVQDTRFFSLAVAAGPLAGWAEPAWQGGFTLLAGVGGMTFVPALSGPPAPGETLPAVPGQLAASDVLRRLIDFVDPRDGTVVRSFRSPGAGEVRGLAFDGVHLFASGRDTQGPRIFKLDLNGQVLDAFPSPTVTQSNGTLEGLAFLGGVLYGTYVSPPILFAIDPATHRLLWQRDLPSGLTGLDAAPEGLLGIDSGGTLYLVDPTQAGDDVLLGDVLDTGLTGLPSITALAYDGNRVFAFDGSHSEVLYLRGFGLWWALDGTLRAYVPEGGRAVDVIQGDVEQIVQLSGYVDLGAPVCLVSRGAGGVVPTAAEPPPGHAFFYEARFVDGSGFETSYGRGTLGFRRLDSTDACP